ncbi:hypothetical protein [Stenotrophomonas sp.]|uniref:prealbumin-like fold domain-containing protein n=1 Tax=Stenotrophomonas sp. TaxID=69392 RepID=UPI00289B3605|nr:hypothetical protein [Stenotrophomonas sp.]
MLLMLAVTASGMAQTVQISKTSEGGVGTFDFNLLNLSGSNDTITTSAAGAATPSASVFSITDPTIPVGLTEVSTPGFGLTDAYCEDTSGTTPGRIGTRSGNSLIIPTTAQQPTATLVCTFVNIAQTVDLAISKQATPTVVASGGTVTFTLTATNVGSVDITNAVLADSPGIGLSCTSAGTCSPSGTAVCPGSVPPGSLFGAGVVIPSIPTGSGVVVQVACTVTATGR